MKTTTLVIKATTKKLVAIKYNVLVHTCLSALFLSSDVVVAILIGSLK